MNWTYQNKTINDLTDFPPDAFGFVYKVIHIPTNKEYIGKKVLFFNRKVKLGKRELLALPVTRGRRSTTKQVVKESDWKTYYGSQTNIKQLLLEGKKDEFERTILKVVETKKQLTYFEIKYQMLYQVLEKPDEFFNDNILGKFFTRDLADLKFEDSVSNSI